MFKALQRPIRASNSMAGWYITPARSKPVGQMSKIPVHLPRIKEDPAHGLQFGVLQTKLKISKPGDPYEEEADRIAEQVIHMQELGTSMHHTTGEKVKPKCERCQGKTGISRKISDLTNVTDIVSGGIGEITDNLRRGHPLDRSARASMESRFGFDFSKVRIHTDERAAQTAQMLNALAYTIGQNIVFGSGQYQPNTVSGKTILAHELAHVVQQNNMNASANTIWRFSPLLMIPSDAPSPEPTAEETGESNFPDCTDEQKDKIRGAITTANDWLRNSIAALSTTSLDANTIGLLNTHFKTHDASDVSKILANFNSIQSKVGDESAWECETVYSSPWCLLMPYNPGYTYKFSTTTSHLCDWVIDAYAPLLVWTLIHETAHRVDLRGDVYEEKAEEYKAMSKEEALNNADSYTAFAGRLNKTPI